MTIVYMRVDTVNINTISSIPSFNNCDLVSVVDHVTGKGQDKFHQMLKLLHQANIPTHMLTGDENTKYHIGTNALSFPREKAEVVMPLKDGMSELFCSNQSITN